MRYAVLGAGAVGGTIGGALARAGHEVVLIARGAHGEAMAARGLELATPGWREVIRVPVFATAADAGVSAEDVVILAVKSQDTAGVVASLPTSLRIACAQNGVANEAAVAAAGHAVYPMMVWMPAVHLEPGLVENYAVDPLGALRVGCFPDGSDELAVAMAEDLRGAGFDAAALPDVMRWKYGKLLTNLGNAIDAYFESPDRDDPLFERLTAEGVAVLDAAGIDYVDAATLIAEMRAGTGLHPIDGKKRAGGSTWQSATRGTPTSEVAYLNQTVCELGAAHGVATPINAALVALTRDNPAPRSLPLSALSARVSESQAAD